MSGSTKGNEYFRHIRLEFANSVKIHVIVTFSGQQFVEINEGIQSFQDPGVGATYRMHYVTSFWDVVSAFLFNDN